MAGHSQISGTREMLLTVVFQFAWIDVDVILIDGERRHDVRGRGGGGGGRGKAGGGKLLNF